MGSPFSITGGAQGQSLGGAVYEGDDHSLEPTDRVRRMIGSSEVFLFMKGTPRMPRCGFSANTVAVLESLGASYRTFDVLSDEAIRAAVKEVAAWPTFPQLWVRGELVGGNDIVTEMYASGELASVLGGGDA
jgi:monothiol glutaredoxin